ncbi:MAG: phosphatase PAP2 family protein [Clostridia bacterium]|nr:phosphatase PAP2 family protein [Clostridia bacterium]
MLQRIRLAMILPVFSIFYFTWFSHIERNITLADRIHVIHMALDDYIPFCEWFIIPYFLWFAYVASVIVIGLFTDEKAYVKSCIFLFTGMTLFLIVSTIYPNGHHLRPNTFAHQNIFTSMVAHLYSIDTPTNLFPSIHVYNSIGAHIALTHNRVIKEKRWICNSSLILCISIVLSTVFLKQHSVFDVITAFLLVVVLYPIVYRFDYATILAKKQIRQSAR